MRPKNNTHFSIIIRLSFIYLVASGLHLNAQDTSASSLKVIHDLKTYKQQVTDNPENKMLELKSLAPTLIYELHYASTDNFMKRLMYPPKTNQTFMRSPAAKALAEVQVELEKKGLGIKIFDAYRPYAVTKKFWELVHDERYVANPAKGSGHNRGIAVDMTLIKLADKAELNMGTGFDNFTDTAHHSFTNLSEETLSNRKLLKETMEAHGFVAFPTEWWHYFLKDGDRFDVLDIPFKELGKAK